MGSDYLLTPHLDSLAASGALLTGFYSNSPVCSPSRASLLTGRYPAKAGVRSIIEHHRWAPGLPADVPTLPSELAKAGYATGLAGKWHLGTAANCRPGDHGFEESFGPLSGTVDYFSHINYSMNNRTMVINGTETQGTPLHDLWEDDSEVWEDGQYMTEAIGERAVDFIRRKATEEHPFFLEVAFTAPHFPLHAPKKYRDRFPGLSDEKRIIAAMLSAMDDAIGTIIGELEDQGVRNNTLVWFLSDNGPSREIRNWLDGNQEPFFGGDTGGLKGHKFSLFEGGIRVPSIVSWPEGIGSGRVISEPIAAMDVLPTVAAIADLTPGGLEDFDGQNVLEVLNGSATTPHEELYWEQGGQTAIRAGDWKLVLNGQLIEQEGPVEDMFLSNIVEDPGEKLNLAEKYPRIAQELTDKALSWRTEIDQIWANVWLPRIGTGTTFQRPSFVR